MPELRTKSTRGLLPLQMDHRMKLGWDWPRRAASTMSLTSVKAVGWVVCWSAWRTAERVRWEILSSRGEVGAR